MNEQEFDSQRFYPGIEADVSFAGKTRRIKIQKVDFIERIIFDQVGNASFLELGDIHAFHPPSDYSPCLSCGAIHHPGQNTLCKRLENE